MNVEIGSYIKVELYNEDANLFFNALMKVTKEKGAMGFKMYGISDDEMKVLSSIIDSIG